MEKKFKLETERFGDIGVINQEDGIFYYNSSHNGDAIKVAISFDELEIIAHALSQTSSWGFDVYTYEKFDLGKVDEE